MANYCNYEIHVRGSKKAALFLFNIMPTYDHKGITYEEGADDDYVVWITGGCKWDLDAYCEEQTNVDISLDEYSEDDIRYTEVGLDYWYLTMRQKSEVLGVEILAHSWSEESGFDKFDHYLKGELLSTKSQEIGCLEWDKSDCETFEEYCEEYEVDPNVVTEDMFVYDEFYEVYICEMKGEEYTFDF